MHVLQVLPTLRVGGVERGVLDLTKGLIARGHRVSVVSSGGPLVARLTALGAAHHTLPVHAKSLVTMWRCVPALARLIDTTGVDLVHARSRVPAWIGFAASRLTQRPFITTAHGFYAPHLGSRVMVWGRLVIAPSETLGLYLVDRFRLPKDRLRVIPRGVDLEEFTVQPPAAEHQGPWRLGLFGRLSAIKGHTVALQACARLRRQGLDVTLCIAGDIPGSPARQALEALAAELKLTDAVEWLGVRDDIPSLIASVDLVLVPSTYPESFGRSVVEAQAVGRPVVASSLGALREVVDDGRSGLLVRPGDPEALAEAVGRFLHDASLRARCVEAGRRQVEAVHHLDRMVEQTLEAYDESLHRPRILLWKLSALGDVILATPSLRAIRRQFPNAQITLAVGRRAYEAVARCPYLNAFLIYDPARKDRGVWGHLALLRRLRQGAFDLSVDFQNSRTTHLLAWLAGIPVRVGYRRKCGWLLNRGVRLPRVVLAPVAHQHYLLRKAGFATDGEALEVWPSSLDEEAAERLLAPVSARDPSTRPPRPSAGGGLAQGRPERAPRQRGESKDDGAPLVAVHPGGSGRWKTKRWDLERWARLCDALAQRNIAVVVTGGADERALGEALTRLTSSKPLIVIGQTSVMALACLIKRCHVLVAHDSSPVHLASAVGTPVVALFGPTDPARHLAPTFTGVVLKKDVFCSPCYSTRCRTITHACMKRIGFDEVLSAVLGLLAEAELATPPVSAAR